MKKQLLDRSDYLIELAILISAHSINAPENEPMYLKASRKRYMFSIMEYLRFKVNDAAFKDIAFLDTKLPLYCYSTLSFEELIEQSKTDTVLICTSKKTYIKVRNDYKYHYEFRLKEGKYAIDINKFISLFTKNKLKRLRYLLYDVRIERGEEPYVVQDNEDEVIVNIKDINLIRKIKL